jgi:hypothetical protein
VSHLRTPDVWPLPPPLSHTRWSRPTEWGDSTDCSEIFCAARPVRRPRSRRSTPAARHASVAWGRASWSPSECASATRSLFKVHAMDGENIANSCDSHIAQRKFEKFAEHLMAIADKSRLSSHTVINAIANAASRLDISKLWNYRKPSLRPRSRLQGRPSVASRSRVVIWP